VGRIVLANPPYSRLDLGFEQCLREAVHEASESDIRVLVSKADGPNFSLGADVREWPGKDVNWFRTFVAQLNSSYRAIEALRVPTVTVVSGLALGGGFEIALSCDFIVVEPNSVFGCVEVTTAMLPIAGPLQRLAERVGRGRASRFAMLGEPISGSAAERLGVVTHLAETGSLERVANELVAHLADGPTLSYAATRALLKAWSGGGVASADVMMMDVCIGLYNTEDATRGFINTAKAFDAGQHPDDLVFHGK
jgi:enoyl-CoA hydratase/carnithine racemase